MINSENSMCKVGENMKESLNFKKDGKALGSLSISPQNNTSAQLYIYGDIVDESWQSEYFKEDVCPQDIVDFLKKLDTFQQIDIYINSGGGAVYGGIAIYNILKRHPGKKTVHVDGIAASIASVIALAGDEVICPSNAQIMIHKPFIYTVGNADDLRKAAEQLDAAQENILSVYMQHTKDGITKDQVNQMMNDETWLTGSKAAEIFNITVTDTVDMAACAKSTYFEKYKNIPDAVRNRIAEEDKNDEVERLRLELELICL